MTSAIRRPFAGESDIPRLSALIAACQAMDRVDSPYLSSLHELRETLLDPTLGWTREVALWESGSEIVAFAFFWVPPSAEGHDVYLWFSVHPSAREGDLTSGIVAWAAERASVLAGPDAVLMASAREDDHWRLASLSTFGFTPIRVFLRMVRKLDDDLPVPSPPSGYQIRPVAGLDELDAWVDLFNAAFADHWNHIPLTSEEHRIQLGRAHYRQDLDLVVVAPDGTLAAFCSCAIKDHDDGRREAWIDLVGTRPAYRRRGLASAVIAAGLTALRAHGPTEAKLGVDAESPTSATALYESLGFAVAKTTTVFRRPVRETRAGNPMNAAPSSA
jgi:mycothiol synthase